jgi:autotransporter-associated beta strand protein
MKTPSLSLTQKLSLTVLALVVSCIPARAATEHWTAGGSDLFWSDASNWSSPQQSYFNNVDFIDNGGTLNLSDFSVNNIVDNTSATAQMPIYMLRMYPTNRNFTTQINSGIALYTGAGTGDLYVGGDTITASRGMANLQETITFQGAGALFAVTGTLHVGQGMTNTVQTTPPSTNYVTLNMSGLDTFVMAPSIAAGTTFNGVSVARTASGTAGSRFLLCGQIRSYSQAGIYLAKTNFITCGNDMELGAMGTYSNSMPCPLYLGMVNTVLVGNNGSANGLVTVGSRGNTNCFMVFNPAFLGGATPPSASFASPPSINGGRVTTFYVCRSDGGVIPAYGYADYSGGNVSIMASTMHLGYAGTNGLTARGVLTFDNGIVNVNNVNVGNQTVSAGGAGIGIINVKTNSTYGTNGTLIVNNVMTLGAVTGTLTAGTSGTLNLNGASLVANVITNNGGTATVNMTNSTWSVTLTNATLTNMTLTAFNGGGATNVVNVGFITPSLPSSYPVRFHLISASSITGGATLGLGPLPPSFDPSHPYAGYIDSTSTPGLIDLVLTAGPASARSLTWTGTNSLGAADGDWDVASTSDWLAAGAPTTYNQFDLVSFADVPSTAQTNVNLTTTLTPYSVIVSNNASLYTFDSGGSISGVTGITKLGTNTLIIDNSSANNYTGVTTISAGTVQVGNNDGNGNLPAGGSVVDNAVLAFDPNSSATVNAVISGTGAVVANGGGTVQLASANSFSGNAIATNGTTLQGGVVNAFGTGAGSVVIANGSTLDPKGVGTSKGVTVSGTGVGGNGAIVNSGGAIYDSGGGLTPTLTLAGNTLLSYPTRWDLGGSGATTATLSTGGNPYNLTLNGDGNYFEWRNVQCDSKLGDIYIQSGTLGYVGSTTAGNPTNSLVISNGTGMTFYNGSVNPTINKIVVVQDGGNINVGAGGATITGTLALNNVNSSQFCKVTVGSGLTLTISNVSGNGIFYVPSGGGNIVINGNASAFTGGVDQFAGLLSLVNVPFGSGITNSSACVFQGSGTVAGVMDIAGPMTVGTPTAAGSLTNTGLVLEGSAILTNNLGGTTTIGGGVNSYIRVNGPLTVNGNNIIINPLAPLVNGTYTLMTVTGGITGTFGTAQTAQTSSYTFTLNTVPSGPNTLVQLVVSGGQPSVKVWNNNQGNGEFDVNISQNWSNATSHFSPDYFIQYDSVLLDDTISTSPNPSANLDIASGQAVTPTILTNNSVTNNYTISGAGSIAGLTSIVKLGSSTLTISTTNSFTGNVTVAGGVLKAGPNASLGAATGTVYVTNGATLDIDYSLGNKPLVISGNGINGLGALVNNDASGTPVYDNPGGLQNVTLAGNTTIGGTNRVDFGKYSPNSGVVSSSGNNYSLTVVGPTYREWDNVTFDANFGNINIMTTNGGSVGIKGSTSLGNPTNVLTVISNASITLYQDTAGPSNVVINKAMKLNGGSTLANGAGTNVILSPISIGSNSSDTVTFNIGGNSLTVSNVISGAGNLTKTGSSPLYLTATNTYTGNTVISGSPLVLTNNGSISSSANILLGSGQVLDAGGRSDGTLTLALGQTLGGAGTIDGSLLETSVAVLVVGNGNGTGTLTVTNNVNLQGTTSMGVGVGSNNLLTCASISYGGTLSLSFIPGSLTNGQTFKLFNSTASSYSGSFSITPSTPGTGLVWDTSQLNTTGTLGVLSSGGGLSPATFGASVVAGTNLTLNGTGGTHSGTYHVYSSTDLTIPLINWNLVGSGSFDTNGNFSFGTSISSTNAQNFYILKEP